MQIPQGKEKLKCSVLHLCEAWGLCSLQLSENACGLQGTGQGGAGRGNPKQEPLLHAELMMFNLSFKHPAACFCRLS